jgi:hypothetical protein
MEEGLNEIGHGGFVAELTGVAFDGTETGIVDDTVGQSGLADARRAIQEDRGRSARGGAIDPGQQGSVFGAVEVWAPGCGGSHLVSLGLVALNHMIIPVYYIIQPSSSP